MVQLDSREVASDFSKGINGSFVRMTLLIIVSWLAVCILSQRPGIYALDLFLSAAAIMLLATIVVVRRFHLAGQRIPFLWIFLTAALLRFVSLLGVPLFEDDYFRYLWDGFQTVTTQDPYTLAPAVFFDRDVPEIFEPILSLINYPEIATVYGPVTEWIFALGYLLSPGQVWPLQLFAGLADLGVLLLLYRLGAGNALLFYAWSPLLLKEFALTAHPDIFAILGLIGCIYVLSLRQTLLAGVILGLGFGAKVFAILALPYLLTLKWSVRFWVTFLGAFAATLLAITLWYGSVLIWVPEGLRAMADSWLFNAGLYLALLKFFEFQTLKYLLLAGFMVYGLLSVLLRLHRLLGAASAKPAEEQGAGWHSAGFGFRGDWLFLVFILALPVINPWYITWILPFATLYPRCWSWALSYFVLFAYWYGTNAGLSGAGSLQLPVSVIIVEYTAVLAVSLLAWIVSRRLPHYREFAGL